MSEASPARHLAVARAALERQGFLVDVTLGAPDPDALRRLVLAGAGTVPVRRFFAALNGARVQVRGPLGETLAELTLFDAATLLARREHDRFPLAEIRGVACFLRSDGIVVAEDSAAGDLPAEVEDVETWFYRVCHALMRRGDPRWWRPPEDEDAPG